MSQQQVMAVGRIKGAQGAGMTGALLARATTKQYQAAHVDVGTRVDR